MKIVKYSIYPISFAVMMYFSIRHPLTIEGSVFSDAVTFLSITIGFGITSLSIIATSKFSNTLYGLEDERNNSRTLLHVLVDQFKNSIILFTAAVAVTFFYYILDKNCSDCIMYPTQQLNTISFLKTLIIYLLILSFIVFIRLIVLFSRFVIKSARSN